VPAPPADRALLDEAVELARAAGASTTAWFRSTALVVDHKGDGTPVTEADRAAERLIREHLAAAHPDDAVVGEEEGPTPGTTGRCWVIDPIDGTKAFTHGVPLYSTLLAVDDEHGPAVGVIELPALTETVYAGRGLGCFCNGERVHVSDAAELRGAYLTTSGYDHWPDDLLLAAKGAGLLLRTWGDGYGYALVATGRVEAMVDTAVARYDVAAMPVILSEAGGRFSDFAGAPRTDTGTGLATNGRLHDPLLALLQPFSRQ
jgi:histidinol phosphatase-like enzyme (inositol monophosphatase family)